MMVNVRVLLEFQAGLSWQCVLHKRENFKRAFDYFYVEKIALYGPKKEKELIMDESLIRNRLKIKATIQMPNLF